MASNPGTAPVVFNINIQVDAAEQARTAQHMMLSTAPRAARLFLNTDITFGSPAGNDIILVNLDGESPGVHTIDASGTLASPASVVLAKIYCPEAQPPASPPLGDPFLRAAAVDLTALSWTFSSAVTPENDVPNVRCGPDGNEQLNKLAVWTFFQGATDWTLAECVFHGRSPAV